MSNIIRPLLSAGQGKTYVEIGGIKWATVNIGASSETDYGLYFQWGDTTGYTASQVGSSSVNYKKPFYMSDCVLHNGTATFNSGAPFTKYNGNDSLTELEPINDAAVANWGGKWRMPTYEEFQTLTAAVNTAWETDYNGSGVSGLLCTDKTDSTKKLFFPAGGKCTNGSRSYDGSEGYYWSSSIDTSRVQSGFGKNFDSNGSLSSVGQNRYIGLSIRPVLDE